MNPLRQNKDLTQVTKIDHSLPQPQVPQDQVYYRNDLLLSSFKRTNKSSSSMSSIPDDCDSVKGHVEHSSQEPRVSLPLENSKDVDETIQDFSDSHSDIQDNFKCTNNDESEEKKCPSPLLTLTISIEESLDTTTISSSSSIEVEDTNAQGDIHPAYDQVEDEASSNCCLSLFNWIDGKVQDYLNKESEPRKNYSRSDSTSSLVEEEGLLTLDEMRDRLNILAMVLSMVLSTIIVVQLVWIAIVTKQKEVTVVLPNIPKEPLTFPFWHLISIGENGSVTDHSTNPIASKPNQFFVLPDNSRKGLQAASEFSNAFTSSSEYWMVQHGSNIYFLDPSRTINVVRYQLPNYLHRRISGSKIPTKFPDYGSFWLASSHSMVKVGHRFWIMGGTYNETFSSSSVHVYQKLQKKAAKIDTWIWSLTREKWFQGPYIEPVEMLEYHSFHHLLAINDHQVMIIGGVKHASDAATTGRVERKNFVQSYNFKTAKWKQYPDLPHNEDLQCCQVVFDKNPYKISIFIASINAKIHSLDLAGNEWQLIQGHKYYLLKGLQCLFQGSLNSQALDTNPLVLKYFDGENMITIQDGCTQRPPLDTFIQLGFYDNCIDFQTALLYYA